MAASLSSGGTLGVAQTKELGGFSKRVIALLTERAELNAGIKEVMDEAAEAGFDRKILRKAVKRVMADEAALVAEEEMIDSYVHAIKQGDLFEVGASAKAA